MSQTWVCPLCSGSSGANGLRSEICVIAKYTVGEECLARRDVRLAIDTLDPANFELVVAKKWAVKRSDVAEPMRPSSVLSALKITQAELWELLDRRQLPAPAHLGGLVVWRRFGFDSWDRQTLAPKCHWTHLQQGETVCFYSTKVRITVRAGDTVTIREGIGTGFGRASQPELAHDMALKAAETDATKRALATFGNPFGLALYDRDQAQVTKARSKPHPQAEAKSAEPEAASDLALIDVDGREVRFPNRADFIQEALHQIERLDTDA